MARRRDLRPGYVVIHPNRDRAICRLTRLVVAAILVGSVALIMAVTVGGWSGLQGMKPVNFGWSVVYLIAAFYIVRWARGLLPIAATLGVLLLSIAVIAALGLDGTSWFDRAAPGFAAPRSLFGGSGLGPDTLGLLTALLIPLQLALIAAATIAFAQGWNLELEVPAGPGPATGRIGSGRTAGGTGPDPAPARTGSGRTVDRASSHS